MTVPIERTNAVIFTHNFLLSLLDPKATPRVPKSIRDDARRLLRHYPAEFEMDVIGFLKCPGYLVKCFFCQGMVGAYYTLKDIVIGLLISCIGCTKEWFGEDIIVEEYVKPSNDLIGYLFN